MTKKLLTLVGCAFMLSCLLFSCKKESIHDSDAKLSSQQSSSSTLANPITGKWRSASSKITAKNQSIFKTDEYYKDLFSKLARAGSSNVVAPSECSATPFDAVIDAYISEFGPLETVLREVANAQCDALMVFPDSAMFEVNDRVAQFAIEAKLPSVSGWAPFARNGLLASYGRARNISFIGTICGPHFTRNKSSRSAGRSAQQT